MIYDTYIGGVHYWIRCNNGKYEVRRETPDYCDDNETMFRGRYESCLSYLRRLKIMNMNDLNI